MLYPKLGDKVIYSRDMIKVLNRVYSYIYMFVCKYKVDMGVIILPDYTNFLFSFRPDKVSNFLLTKLGNFFSLLNSYISIYIIYVYTCIIYMLINTRSPCPSLPKWKFFHWLLERLTLLDKGGLIEGSFNPLDIILLRCLMALYEPIYDC